MSLDFVEIGELKVSRLIIGGNPFSGFSHQGREMDLEMKRYYKVDRIKATLREAESLGINTFIGRADRHITRMLMEYWDEGGEIRWIAQTCPELGDMRSVHNAIEAGAKACYIHGGATDYRLAQGKLDEIPPIIDAIREAGIPAGIAGHNPEVFRWAEGNLDVDFYMCCYYNSARRDERTERVPGRMEWFFPEDRDIMRETIQTLSKPAIHYKVLAAGRNDPREAFRYVASALRPGDAVCVGVYTGRKPDILKEDVRLLEESLKAKAAAEIV